MFDMLVMLSRGDILIAGGKKLPIVSSSKNQTIFEFIEHE
jgi:hypothetical protein